MLAFLLSLLAFVPTVYADAIGTLGTVCVATANGVQCPEGAGISSMWDKICATLPFCNINVFAPEFIAEKIINIVFVFITLAGIIVLIYAGIQLTMSQGDEQAYSNAKRTAMWAAAGIVLAIVGRPLLLYVANFVIPAFVNG